LIAGEEEIAGRALAAGAPPTVTRLALAMRRRRTTLNAHANRHGWVKAQYDRADSCWDTGDVTGTQVERSIAVLEEHGLPLLPFAERAVAAVARQTGITISVPMERLATSAEEGAESADAEAVEVEGAAPLSLDEQFLRLGAMLSRQIGMFIGVMERSGGLLKKMDLDALSVLLRLAERFDAMAAEKAAEQQKRSDDEVAGILERVDERIVELAHAHAERLGREEFHE